MRIQLARLFLLVTVCLALWGCPQPEVIVPDCSGMTLTEAGAAIGDAGLVVGEVAELFSPTVAAGCVISQDPAAGETVERGAAVDLFVSKGLEPILVPHVIGMDESAAELALVAAGLTVGAVTEAYSDAVPAGAVVSQEPVPGTSAATGAAVDIVVSKGPAPVTVPDLVGMTRWEAEAAIATAGLSIGAVTSQFSETVALNGVIGQDPGAGQTVAPGAAVSLVVSIGPELVTVPNLAGMTVEAAQAAIAVAGLAVGSITEFYSETVSTGLVISQVPLAGIAVAGGTGVNLRVSKGREPVAVPDIVGMSDVDAAAAITGAGLASGSVTQQFHATVPAGLIISQTPPAGTMVPPGTTVDRVVSKGPAPVAVPDLVGMTEDDAVAAITAAGLELGTVTEQFSLTVPAGLVIDQEPAPGTMVAPGSAVNLFVSRGHPPVTFADPNLEAAVRAAIGKPQGDLFPADLEGLTQLDVRNLGITDLAGMEYCTGLTDIEMSENQIGGLQPLAGLTNLQFLSFMENQVEDLSPLSGLINLEILNAGGNQIADLVPLAGLTNLSILFIWGNNISDLSPLAGLTTLTDITAHLNQISDISPLAGLTNLQALSLSGNQVSDISPLASLPLLFYLCLEENQISDISPVAGLTAMEVFYADDNAIVDITPLAGMTDLFSLSLSRNEITDITPLASLASLRYLYLDGNDISDIGPLDGMISLEWLRLAENQIARIDALLDNAGISSGDHVFLTGNPLSQIALCLQIPALLDRGVIFEDYGVCIGEVEVPDIAGMTWAEAEAAITYAGFAVGTVTEAYSEAAPAGLVFGQDPAAGATASFGDPVDFTVSLGAEPISFPDPYLEAAVREAIEKPVGDIYRSDLIDLTVLQISFSDVADLTGIEHCTHLVELSLYNTQVSDITPVAALTNLIWLYVSGCPLSDISPVAGLTNLQHVGFYQDQVSDITPLAGLTNLITLRLERNQINDVTPLAALVKLQSLSLDENQVNDISALAGFTELRYIYLFRNLITSITPIVGLGDLVYVGLTANPLDELAACVEIPLLQSRGVEVLSDTPCDPVSVPSLVGMTPAEAQAAITAADLTVGTVTERYSETDPPGLVFAQEPAAGESAGWGSPVNFTVSLGCEPVTFNDACFEFNIRCQLNKEEGTVCSADMAVIVNLNLAGQPISDLTGIEHCTNLTYLWLRDCQIADLSPLAGLVNLRVLYLSYNLVSDLTPLAGLTNLEQLNLNGNLISDLSPLANLTALMSLDVGNNQISDLSPLAGLTSLYQLSAHENAIEDLTPLAELTSLWGLQLGVNQISDLAPLSNLINLTGIEMSRNLVTDLTPLADLTALVSLFAPGNQITDVTPLQGLPALSAVNLAQNQISDLGPLGANPGLGEGDFIGLTQNPLDQEALCLDIPALDARGATVQFDGVCAPVMLPDLIGMTQAEAEAAITGANLTVGSVTEQYSETEPLGLVFAQDPGAGESAGWGSPVNFTVSLGPEPVTFPDWWFEVMIRNKLNNYDEPIYRADMATIPWLDLMCCYISDITGIEHCVNLASLNLHSNLVTDLSPLAGLVQLEELNLYHNQVSDLTPLAGLVNLRVLDLQWNLFTDLTPLAGLTNLQELTLYGNSISDLSRLSNLTNLTFLDIGFNQISDLGPLAGLSNLNQLNAYMNQIADLTPLAGLTSLTILFIDTNQISDLTPLAGLIGLTHLGVGENLVADLTPLTGLTALESLGAAENLIVDLTPLESLTSLRNLYLNFNQVSDLQPLANLTALKYLFLRENVVSDLSALSGLPELTLLNLVANQITDLGPLAGNLDLGYGCMIEVTENHLDQEALCEEIPAIRARYVSIDFDGRCGYEYVLDVVFLTRGEAEAAIVAAGYTVGTILEVCSTAPVGEVLAQDPAAGSHRLLGSPINIEVSCGSELLSFPDSQLEAVVRAAINKPEGDIYCSEVSPITSLDASDYAISDLSGLEYFVHLWLLKVGPGELADLTPLAGLTKLWLLYLPSNQISDLSPLAGLTHLGALDFSSNLISDISPLAGLTNTTSLDISDNDIADIAPLSGMIRMQTLRIEKNRIRDIGVISTMLSLRTVDLSWNQVSALDPLVINTGLGWDDWVDVQRNPLDQQSICSELPALDDRGVRFNNPYTCGFASIPPLEGLSLAEAEISITAMGLVVGAVTDVYDTIVPAGDVISHTPAPGMRANLGTPVDLVVSAGAEP